MAGLAGRHPRVCYDRQCLTAMERRAFFGPRRGAALPVFTAAAAGGGGFLAPPRARKGGGGAGGGAALRVFTGVAAGGVFFLARAGPKKVEGATGGSGPSSAHFVGSGACAGCHPVEQAAWSSSHHRHAMEPAHGESVLGDFG